MPGTLRVNLIKKERTPMSLEDKIKNTAQDVAGKAKEGLGEATGDEQLKTEGKVNQATASAKDALADAKDAASEKAGEAADQAKGLIDGLKK